ncbi:MAG: molybdate ABC transporter substrate-binding protein [Chitinophagaceae bacterium]
MTRFSLYFLFIFFICLDAFAQSQPLRLAVAANAQFVVKALQADFKTKTGIETQVIIGSSGNLTTQIKNGAPFDMFLSADMDFPNNLYKEGFGTAKPKEYALGSLVVCSNQNLDIKNWRLLLTGDDIKKIAVANPAVAPYGKAAEEALRYYALWDKSLLKLVFGESISQVNTYITTGAVSLGFTTEALIYEYPGKDKLTWVKVDENVYGKIRQGLIVLNYSRKGNYEKAMKFFNYISSPAAKDILKKFGYRSS